MKAVLFSILLFTLLFHAFHPFLSHLKIEYDKITIKYTAAGESRFVYPSGHTAIIRYEVAPNRPNIEYIPANPETLNQYELDNATCTVTSIKARMKFRDNKWRTVEVQPISCKVVNLRYECGCKAPDPRLCGYYFFAGGECYRCTFYGELEITIKLPDDVMPNRDVKPRDLSVTIIVPRCKEGWLNEYRCVSNILQRKWKACPGYEWRDYKNCDEDDGFVGERYCKDNKVVQKYRDYYCYIDRCEYNEYEKVIEECSYACENGKCITPTPPKPTNILIKIIEEIIRYLLEMLLGIEL